MEEKKKCKHCQSVIDKKASICPNCNKGQKNLMPIWITFAIIGVFMIMVLILAINVSKDIPTNNNYQSTSKTEKFSLLKENKHFDGYNFYIDGEIKNNTNKQYSYVQVSFNLYDKNGAQIGTAIDNINNLEAQGIWKFKAMYFGTNDAEVDRYKLIEIIGY